MTPGARRAVVLAIVFVVVANLVAVGVFLYSRWAAEPPDCTPEQPGAGFEEIRRTLALTPDQETRFLAYRKTYHENLTALSAEQTKRQTALLRELRNEKPDPALIEEITAETNRLQREAQNRVIEHWMNIKGLLTPAQQELFFDIVSRRMTAEPGPPSPGRLLRGP